MTGLFGMQGIRRPLSDSTAGGLLGMAGDTSFGFAIRPKSGIVRSDGLVGRGRGLRRRAPTAPAGRSGGSPPRAACASASARARKPSISSPSGFAAASSRLASRPCLPQLPFQGSRGRARERTRRRARVPLQGRAPSTSSSTRPASRTIASSSSRTPPTATRPAPSSCSPESGEPVFVVNEGEYQMMNTLDLTVDQAFWERASRPGPSATSSSPSRSAPPTRIPWPCLRSRPRRRRLLRLQGKIGLRDAGPQQTASAS